MIPDTVNKNAFLCSLETTLLPTLPKGSVLVMDNWTVHHGGDVRNLVEACGCELLYLPTYSPDFVLGKTAHRKGAKFQPSGPARNPIEHLFAKLRAFIKALRPDSTDKLIQAFCDATKTLTPENVRNSFQHCGYGVVQ